MKSSNKNVIVAIVAIAIIALLYLVVFRDDKSNDASSTIKIGAPLSLTGTLAHGGIEASNALKMLVDEVNAAGGIKGRKVELIVGNTNTEPERASSVATKLANEDKVLAIIGPDNTGTALAVKLQVAEPDEVVAISVTGSSPKLTDDNPRWFFRGATPAAYQMRSLSDYLIQKRGYKKIAILCDAMLTDQADALKNDLARFNLEPVAMETHKSGATNFNGQLLSIRPLEPDVIFFIGFVTECVSAIKQARDMGINAQFAGSIGIVYDELCTVGGSAVEGVLGTIGFTASNLDPKVQEFCEKFIKLYKETPAHAAGQAYDQLTLVLQAIRESDLTFKPADLREDRRKIRDWLETKANGFQGLTGRINYTRDDHTAYKEVNIMIVQDGKWKVLKDE